MIFKKEIDVVNGQKYCIFALYFNELKMEKGKLYLIPTTLGETPWEQVLPSTIKEVIGGCEHFIVENEKSARRFIKKVCPEKPQNELQLYLLNQHTPENERLAYLKPCLEGKNMGVISEAGCPAIADPGSDMVALSHQKGIQVEPLVGPSSIILSLMGSGFNGQNFAFNGYLPIDKNERKSAIKHFEAKLYKEHQTQIFIETPYRNLALLQDFIQHLKPETKLCVACDLTLPSALVKTLAAKSWKNLSVDIHKKPAIFLIGE